MEVLDIQGLGKKIKKRWVVKDVSLTLKPGEIVGLLGPNGAGKTTCFHMIIGLIKGDRGRVLLNQHDITHQPMHQRARLGLGYLPQENSVFRQLTAAENILGVLELDKSATLEQRLSALEALLDEFQLQQVRDSKAQSLSGGERRRVEIARALASRPKFILLDEPFAGVDPISVGEIKKMILELAERGIGILITDHNVRETLGICDRAYIVNNGEILCKGSPQEILDNPTARNVYLGETFVL